MDPMGYGNPFRKHCAFGATPCSVGSPVPGWLPIAPRGFVELNDVKEVGTFKTWLKKKEGKNLMMPIPIGSMYGIFP